MSESENSSADRNLPASEKRLKDAREEGRVARSRELASFLLLGTALFGLMGLGPALFNDSLDLIRQGLHFDRESAMSSGAMSHRLMLLTSAGLISSIPILGLLLLAAIAAPLALGGWNFSWKPILPDFGKLNPLTGVGRLFSSHGLIEMGKASLISLILAAVAVIGLLHNREQFAQLAVLPLGAGIAETGSILLLGLAGLTMVIAVAALIDVPAQLWRHHSALKMTLDEVKRESKESDGNPQIKAKIRAQQREAARRHMMEAVPLADVILTNPTHYAVALSYQEGRMRAPTVVAKGADLVAWRIREIAALHNVPVMEQPALARALHRHAEIGEEVPVALYNAVAQVLAYIYQLKRLTQGAVLHDPGRIDVPAGLDPLQANA